MQFIADGMLGKLTRWLRMLGHDVHYYRAAVDAQLLNMAKAEKRILLTRDQKLYERAVSKGVNAVFVDSTDDVGKLAKMAGLFKLTLEIDMNVSRCPKCNSQIMSVSKESVIEQIPKYTAEYYNDFWKCFSCGQVYWQGAHWKRILKTLEDVQSRVVCG